MLPGQEGARQSDRFLCEPRFGGDDRQLLLGVFDGHGSNGEHCASIAAATFPREPERLRDDPALASHGDRDAAVPHRAWSADEALHHSRAFVETNARVMKDLGDGAKSSGTTAVVAHVVGDMLHMANVGDSRAILGVEDLEGAAGEGPTGGTSSR